MIDSYNAYLLTAIKLLLPYLVVCLVVALVMVKKGIHLPNSTSTNSTNSKNLLWKWWCQTCWTGFLLLVFTLTMAFVVIEASCPVVRFYQRYYSTNGNIDNSNSDNNYNCEVIACDYFLLYASIVSIVFVAYIAFNICGSRLTSRLSKLEKLKSWFCSRCGGDRRERALKDHLSKIHERADDLRGIRFE